MSCGTKTPALSGAGFAVPDFVPHLSSVFA
jgi:hypothetical protein